MRITIVPSDQTVIVDGVPKVFPFECDENVHAVQWHETYGFVEYKVGERKRIETLEEFEPIIELYEETTEE